MRLLSLLALATALLTAYACEVETEFVTGQAVQLRFSQDTLTFDTVFTDRGSATRLIKVYNDGDEPVMIDRISVAGMTGVNYTFNADGFRGPLAEDVIIWGRDSIFVFVEVEVDPTDPEHVSPFIAEDRLRFTTGATRREVTLLAFGQNAFYINGRNAGGLFAIRCDGGTAVLPQDLPTVIYGAAFIDSCVVQALPGTRIYVHGGVQRNREQVGGSGIFNAGIIRTEAGGSLQLLGTLDNPVIVRTDRLEAEFAEAVGSYRGLWFGAGSRGNIIRHARLTNAILGVQVDSAAQLTVENSTIAHTRGSALNARLAEVTVRNSLFHSNFAENIVITDGGRYVLDHLSVGSFGQTAAALAAFNFNPDPNLPDDQRFVYPLDLRVRNSILGGNDNNELILADGAAGEEPDLFRVRIDNSVVRTNDEFLQTQMGLFADFYGRICRGCVNLDFSDPLFLNVGEDDYHLDTMSVARDIGRFLPELPRDLEGVERDPETPDAGALELRED